jgi:hypothetical protein
MMKASNIEFARPGVAPGKASASCGRLLISYETSVLILKMNFNFNI